MKLFFKQLFCYHWWGAGYWLEDTFHKKCIKCGKILTVEVIL